MKNVYALAAATMLAGPVFADGHAASGDAAAGEAVFAKCAACHVVMNEAGETLAGKRAKTGPNLFNIAGKPAASTEDFRYGKDALAAGEAGLVWTEETFVTYVQDPTAFLREFLDNKRARSKMSFKLRDVEEATNLYAYLAQFTAEEGS